MNQKNDIMARTYLVFLGIVVFSCLIAVRVLIVQIKEGEFWLAKAKKVQLRYELVEAERGTIYSEAGHVLSTSVPEFDIYVDFKADGLLEKDGSVFAKHVDSLALGLSKLFKDRTTQQYKSELVSGYKKGLRFYLLKRKVSYEQYQQMKQLPLIGMGKNKSGFIAEARMKRLYPFGLMANRTIGIARENNKVGLEKAYDQFLSGSDGKRLVRYIAGGAGVPVEGADFEPVDGCDIITTIDVNMQDIAQQALERMMVANEAERGTCIVMEVQTGKVKAMANLGRQKDGTYWEDFNYALSASEPGSTWKLVTMLAALEDKKVNLESQVNLEGGSWQVAGQTVYDSERHGMHAATVQTAFEKSSNVGMAKLAYQHYNNRPNAFLRYISQLHMDKPTGIDLPGEAKPAIYKPGTRYWSNTTLPWMGFGYNLSVTPLHTAMLYAAVANNGRMMKPYVVQRVVKDGVTVQENEPVVLNDSICSPATLQALHTCLRGVVENGTARVIRSDKVAFAGKTGTSLVADKGIRYSDHVYQSSFAGFFPADKPQYAIVVVIRNKPHAAKYYGGLVAGPVFKEVAERLNGTALHVAFHKDSVKQVAGESAMVLGRASASDVSTITKTLWPASGMIVKPFAGTSIAEVMWQQQPVVTMQQSLNEKNTMPDLTGLSLKDAVLICEGNGLLVSAKGSGKVMRQSIAVGKRVDKGEKLQLQLQ